MPRPGRTALPALILAGLALGGCTSAPPSPSASASGSDGTTGATTAPPSPSVSAAPSSSAEAPLAVELELFAPGVISTDAEEYRISFSPDGTTALFARGTGFFPQARDATIYESRMVDGAWSEPEVASFSGEYPDIDPWFSPDGASVIFSSIRPVAGTPRRDAELFRVEMTDAGWGEPVHLASLGSDTDELGASMMADGTIVFASDRAGVSSAWDLYVATAAADGTFEDPEPLTELNTAGWEFNPAVSADGTLLVFTSIGREGGSGLGDLFLAEREGDAWVEVGPLRINTSADEYHASWSADGELLLFVRRVAQGDLYSVPWSDALPSP